ncbi:MAG: TOBE domain-containing protein [Rouxiella aceris]|jgi:molybdate transport system regulatory protein|uniref:Transporter n=1 Tax=Rouxiella aceris TaxID=2703884 RepID=A0A848MMP9_9GAMM|nr:TOBE domain-containing protein [Rouxiella aceris]MDR3431208.1 TOBE domain-containing protein [Rouxiella aceris]NMP28361.1 transporter [Rouxiella aceris]
MSVSARNQLTGVIASLSEGAVNDEIEIQLNGGGKLVAVVTQSSSHTLGLTLGKEVTALIKASWVLLATPDSDLVFSARNQFSGTITSLEKGAINATVAIKTDDGLVLTAVITNDSVDDMALASGSPIIALVKASSVILAVKKS